LTKELLPWSPHRETGRKRYRKGVCGKKDPAKNSRTPSRKEGELAGQRGKEGKELTQKKARPAQKTKGEGTCLRTLN